MWGFLEMSVYNCTLYLYFSPPAAADADDHVLVVYPLVYPLVYLVVYFLVYPLVYLVVYPRVCLLVYPLVPQTRPCCRLRPCCYSHQTSWGMKLRG